MGGGLMQLVAYGAQDIYLTGNPQITFFKVVYRRHTNFSMETIKQSIDGTNVITGSGGGQGDVTIGRNGDLVTKIFYESGFEYTLDFGFTNQEFPEVRPTTTRDRTGHVDPLFAHHDKLSGNRLIFSTLFESQVLNIEPILFKLLKLSKNKHRSHL